MVMLHCFYPLVNGWCHIVPFLVTLLMYVVSLTINPLYIMILAVVAASCTFMLPVATQPNAIAFSYGYLKVYDILRYELFLIIAWSLHHLLLHCRRWGSGSLAVEIWLILLDWWEIAWITTSTSPTHCVHSDSHGGSSDQGHIQCGHHNTLPTCSS